MTTYRTDMAWEEYYSGLAEDYIYRRNMARDRERSNAPEKILAKDRGNIGVLLWDNGGKTLFLNIPPPKDDPEGEWKEQKINFRFKNQAESLIEVLEKALDSFEEEDDEPRRKSNSRRTQRGFGDETPDHDEDDNERPSRNRRSSGKSNPYRR